MNKISIKKQRYIIIFSFLFLPTLLLIIFSYYPSLKLVQLSLTDWDGYSKSLNYIGIKNYIAIFNDTEMIKVLANNSAYFFTSIIQVFLGLYLAIIINGSIKGSKIFRSIAFMPYVLNIVAIAFMFGYFYDYNNGPINLALEYIGLEHYKIKFIQNSWWSNFSLSAIGLWRYTGLSMVIFLGALQSIPTQLYEAAEIDGANFVNKIRYITLPSIKTIIELNLFLTISGALSAFQEAFVLTSGGPAGRTSTFVTKTLQIAFEYNNFGKASAMGCILLVIIIVITLIQRWVFSSEKEVQNG